MRYKRRFVKKIAKTWAIFRIYHFNFKFLPLPPVQKRKKNAKKKEVVDTTPVTKSYIYDLFAVRYLYSNQVFLSILFVESIVLDYDLQNAKSSIELKLDLL